MENTKLLKNILNILFCVGNEKILCIVSSSRVLHVMDAISLNHICSLNLNIDDLDMTKSYLSSTKFNASSGLSNTLLSFEPNDIISIKIIGSFIIILWSCLKISLYPIHSLDSHEVINFSNELVDQISDKNNYYLFGESEILGLSRKNCSQFQLFKILDRGIHHLDMGLFHCFDLISDLEILFEYLLIFHKTADDSVVIFGIGQDKCSSHKKLYKCCLSLDKIVCKDIFFDVIIDFKADVVSINSLNGAYLGILSQHSIFIFSWRSFMSNNTDKDDMKLEFFHSCSNISSGKFDCVSSGSIIFSKFTDNDATNIKAIITNYDASLIIEVKLL